MYTKSKNLKNYQDKENNSIVERKRDEIKNRLATQLENVNATLDRTELDIKAKKRLYNEFESAYVLKQKVLNTIIIMEDKFAKSKNDLQTLVKKQNLELIRLKNTK